MTELSYESTRPVALGVEALIRREAVAIEPPGRWWAEGINFLPSTETSRLTGSSKIMLLGYGSPARYTQIEPETDMAMALRDASRVIRALSWWSFRHRLNWSLALDGEPVGALVLGLPSPALVANWLKANVLVRFILNKPFLGPVRRAALEQYADRWE